MIVTLAGHVDHGKTSLVRALSGVDTDRLEQEKQRGLTIDLGFAYIDDGNIGFVDVPGHQKFIHNMVAGVAGHQHALLVIAADDGPMPQSKEHLDILSLVGIKSGVIALTKSDRVDQHRLAAAKQEIQQLVAGTFLHNAAIIETSIETPESIQPLLEQLRTAAAAYQQAQDQTPFRLAIDRVFSVKGAGLVVTGTAHTGRISVDDTLIHFPSNTPVRVRGIRAQDQTVSSATAGERCALNITGLNVEDVKRGDWLNAEPQPLYIEASAALRVLDDFPRAVKHWTPVHIYHATSHSTGRIALTEDAKVSPGETAMVDIICDTPLPFRHGDQLVLRDYSLDVTLGGATVTYAQTTQSNRRRSATRRAMLACYATEDVAQSLSTLADERVVNLNAFRQVWHLTTAQMNDQVQSLEIQRFDDVGCSKAYWFKQIRAAFTQVERHQSSNPSSPGLRENQFFGLPVELKQHALNALVQANKLQNSGGLYQLPQHKAELPSQLAEAWKRLEPALDVKQTPSTGDLAKQWGLPQQKIEADLKELAKRGMVTHVANHRFYLPKQLQQLAEDVKQMAAEKPFSVREFRDLTGIGRNVAIEVLEYFDRRGFTRRQDNERIVLKTSLS